MGLVSKLFLCCLMMIAAGYGAYRNKVHDRADGQSLFSFLLDAENFNDWGKLWRIVTMVSFLAVVGVATMKMVAILLGGPIVDLDRFR